jgi:TetR/AcrR family transcriptional regulator, regulator of mycofactocin system
VVTVPLTPDRRERKKQETRAALEAAALRLFAEKGYEHTTVEDIADAADVAVRTFFRYYSSKQHILFGDVAHNIVGRVAKALAARPDDEHPVDAILAALHTLRMGDPDERRQIVDRMRLLERAPELQGTYLMVFHNVHETIADFVAARTGLSAKSDLYPQLLAGATTTAIKASLAVLLATGSPAFELEEVAYAAITAGLRDIDHLR